MISWLLIMVAMVAAVVVVALVMRQRNGGGGTSGKTVRPYLVAIGICWVAPLALMLVLHVVLPHHNSNGQCEGIGFGCVPSPSDGVVIWWALTLPVTFTAGLISCAIIAGVRRGRRKREANPLIGRPMAPPPAQLR